MQSNLAHTTAPSVCEAFAYCEQMARTHYENFPVGSLLIPKARRKHVYSIYAFARTADDFADEDYSENAESGRGRPRTRDERLDQLHEWQKQLDACFDGRATHPVFVALANTVNELQLEHSLLNDLLSAFRQDVVKSRYASFAEVLNYCERSANPVGRLILRLFDYHDPQHDALSDAICTALQLANFWQDIAVDIQKDRVYFPADEMKAFGVSLEDLRAKQATPALRELVRLQVERTRALFDSGRALPGLVSGRLALELRLTWHGGMRILELIEAQGFDTLARRPKITTGDKMRLAFRALWG
jgi:hydroxysqualene synthase